MLINRSVLLYFVFGVASSFSFADINVRVANLKQDMELVSRESWQDFAQKLNLLRREKCPIKSTS